ncbi:serine/threonine protein phosphatase [Sphingobacterium sp. SGG-5]|uniref:calcineurin-like phosphoesterase C-terminal domain-containing protein n=1 Tax=Sphingobacterium sp. SGG-5 TaxID=2710881 RepID=UPI0013EC4B4C|nr:calcineurin-like phosphoesterase family protein [Sphingobacterium sp. SGG-5]NGM60796.1 serine/threonine protein phosphatase [Sphingobacterium sp. SGG-5]
MKFCTPSYTLLLVFLFGGLVSVYGQQSISGHVYDEITKGIAGVVVSCGIHMAQTDENGHYEISVYGDEKYVQISIPQRYLVSVEQTRPIFYQEIVNNRSVYNFHLLKNKKDDTNHVVIVQTDVQAASETEYDIYKEAIVSDINLLLPQYAYSDIFGLDLGDMVGDKPELFPNYIHSMSSLPIPFFRTIGNHDMAYWGRSHETSERHFNQYFGPTTYSFNKGNAHYVVLNNNFFIGRDYFYMGYIDEKTFKWLEKDLSYVPKDKLVFLLVHIPTQLQAERKPFVYDYTALAGVTVNASALYQLLENYETHIISGHTHCNQNVVHHERLYEHNTAAACGTWWQADICTDGTPRGYAVYEVHGNDVEWYYKSAGHDRTYQMRVYRDPETHTIIANIWNYDPLWKVEWFENGVKKGDMEQFEGIDPLARELLSDKRKLKYDWISPSATGHLFRAEGIDDLSKVEVRVTDRFGHVYTEVLKK